MADQLFIAIIWATTVICLSLLSRFIAAAILIKTVRQALRDHPPSVAILIEKVEQRQPWADSLLGVGLIAAAVALAVLAIFETSSARYAGMEFAFLLAGIGASVLFLAQLQRDRFQALLGDWARERADRIQIAPGSLARATSWADVLLVVAFTTIAIAFASMSLVNYWKDSPAMVVGGLLICVAIAAIIRYGRTRAGVGRG